MLSRFSKTCEQIIISYPVHNLTYNDFGNAFIVKMSSCEQKLSFHVALHQEAYNHLPYTKKQMLLEKSVTLA